MFNDNKPYDEDEIFEDFLKLYRSDSPAKHELIPVPEELEATWDQGFAYYVPEMDGSLFLAYIVADAFNELDNFETWNYDHLGYIWVEEESLDEAYYDSPMSSYVMEKWLQLALERYKALFDRLVTAGVEVSEKK